MKRIDTCEGVGGAGGGWREGGAGGGWREGGVISTISEGSARSLSKVLLVSVTGAILERSVNSSLCADELSLSVYSWALSVATKESRD